MTITTFIPYEIDQFYPETAQNAMRILERLGYKVHYNIAQTDAGQMAFENGNWDEAKKIGEKFLKEVYPSQQIVSPSSATVNFITQHYDKLFYNTGMHLAYQHVAGHIFEFCDFIYHHTKARDIGAIFDHPVVFHDCHLPEKHTEMTELLSRVNGIKILNNPFQQEECGANVVFAINNEPIATAMALRQIAHAVKVGAEYIVVADAACKLHFDALIRKQNTDISVIHIVDVLASGIQKTTIKPATIQQ
ncbi:MAG: (Fe-S)-binding protein [Bacteroidales bacterium]|nr:(Fe-S)-binding protein [Bacteroidales bacterium]